MNCDIFATAKNDAGMVELVDTLDLGSSAARCVGSSPSTRTNSARSAKSASFESRASA